MAENKKSFILYADLLHTVQKLPPEKAGELFLTILQYVNDQNPVVTDILVDVAFEPVKQQLKRDLRKWDEYKQKQSENGKRGGRPTKAIESQENPKNPSLFLESQKSLNVNANVSVNANANVNANVTNKKESRAAFAAPTLEDVRGFAQGIGLGKHETPEAFHDYYTANGWKVGRNPMKDWRAAYRKWTRNEKNYTHGTHQQSNEKSLSSRRKGDIDAIREWGQDIIDGRVGVSDIFGRTEA